MLTSCKVANTKDIETLINEKIEELRDALIVEGKSFISFQKP